MNADDPFRLVLLIFCALVAPVGVFHRWRAHTGEKIDRWQEGAYILMGLRPTALVMFVGIIAWLINPASMAWSRLPTPFWLRWTGVAVLICGGAVWTWAVRHLGKNITDSVVTRRQHFLVMTGPYRWVRHPFYVGLVLLLLGIGLLTANWFILLTGSTLWFAFLLPRTRIEERKLVERFGDDYRAYTRRVGRFVPLLRPHRNHF